MLLDPPLKDNYSEAIVRTKKMTTKISTTTHIPMKNFYQPSNMQEMNQISPEIPHCAQTATSLSSTPAKLENIMASQCAIIAASRKSTCTSRFRDVQLANMTDVIIAIWHQDLMLLMSWRESHSNYILRQINYERNKENV